MIQEFNVKGMHCVNCSTGIEKRLNKEQGIRQAKVSLQDNLLTADFDENLLSSKDIIKIVNSLGYKASIKGENIKDFTLVRFIISLCLLLVLVYFAMGKMWGLIVPNDIINIAIQFTLATIILALNFHYYKSGVKAVLNKSPGMDTLIALGSGITYIYSVVIAILFYTNTISSPQVFFEASAMVPTLVTLGKSLEAISRRRTGDALEKLKEFLPNLITVYRDNEEKQIPFNEVKVNDIVVVKQGEKISIDGTVIYGSGAVNQSAITGESMPIDIENNSQVISGSILESGLIRIRAEKVGDDTTFNSIYKRVKEASESKAPVQRIADKVAGVFVPIVCLIALITFLIWFFITKDGYNSVKYAVNVLVISCPCSLGLATPVAIVSATGRGAKMGILFKDAESIELCHKITTVALDKTATLTEGKPQVIETIFNTTEKAKYLKIVASLEKQVTHPIANAILNYCNQNETIDVEIINSIGGGIEAKLDGKVYKLGNHDFAYKNGEEYKKIGLTTIYFTENENLLITFYIADQLKVDSIDAVNGIKEEKVKSVMITGDNEETAKAIATKVGVDNYYYNVLPDGKYKIIKELKENGEFVAMVGDGINDSPALKEADIGIAIGNGQDIAKDSSNIILVNGSIKGVLNTIKLSKKTMRIIKQNLFWAFFYNVLAIPIAAGCFASLGFYFSPAISALCMSISSLFVVLNALRIAKYKQI